MDSRVSNVEKYVRIVDCKEQVLRGKVILLVKILQRHQDIKEATRKSEELRKSSGWVSEFSNLA